MSVTKVTSPMIESGTKGADIASAATVVIGTDGSYFDITGTTGISTQFTVDAGRRFTLQFDGIVTITDNAAITLSGAANFTTAAGDILSFVATAANTVVQTGYSLVDGGSPIAPSGGAWTFISSVTASSSATVNFLSSFSSTYDIYKLFMTAVTPATDGAEPTVRYAIGGAARSTSGDYRWVTDGGRDADNTTGAAQIMASNSATYIRLGNSGGTATGEQNFCEFTIYGVNDTDNHKACTWHMGGTGNGGQTRVYTGSAKLDAVTTAISGIQFLYSTGNVASGEFYLYGLNKS